MTDLPLGSRRIAMFVLNPCTHDARVLRAAEACADAGATVRIFATADSDNPPTLETLRSGVEIQRLDVRSWPQRLRRQIPRAEVTTAAATGPTAPTNSGHRSLRAQLFAIAKSTLRPVHLPSLHFEFGRVAGPAAVEWGADILWGHDLSGLHPAMRAKRSLPAARVVYDSHELWIHRNASPGRLVEAFDARMEQRWIVQADLVITVSPSIARWLQEHYNLATTPTVIRNIPAPGSPNSEYSVRTMAGLQDDARIILYTGRVTTGRGLMDLAQALPQLDANTHVVLLGYDPQAMLAELRATAGTAGDRIHLVGPVPSNEVVAAARSADVAFVGIEPTCLSYEYSLPNKLFEAVHAGLPLVASDLPDIAALVTEFGLGTLFEPGVLTSLSPALRNSARSSNSGELAPEWGTDRADLIRSVGLLL